MKPNKETVVAYTKKWAPKVALFAVVGVTGLAALYAYRGIKSLKNIDFSFRKGDLF